MDPIAWVVIVAVVAIVAQFGTAMLVAFKKPDHGYSSRPGARPPKKSENNTTKAEYVDIDSVKTNLSIPEVKSGNLKIEEKEVKTSKDALNKLKELRGK